MSVSDLSIPKIDLPILLQEILYVDRSWEYINRSQTHENVVIGTEAAQFPEKEYINGILVAVRQRAYLRPIEAGRDGEVAQLVKNLMTLAVDRIVTTEELLRVRIVELHGDAAGCVAVSCRVYQVDSVVTRGVAPATRVIAHRTVLQTVQKRRFGTQSRQSFKLFL